MPTSRCKIKRLFPQLPPAHCRTCLSGWILLLLWSWRRGLCVNGLPGQNSSCLDECSGERDCWWIQEERIKNSFSSYGCTWKRGQLPLIANITTSFNSILPNQGRQRLGFRCGAFFFHNLVHIITSLYLVVLIILWQLDIVLQGYLKVNLFGDKGKLTEYDLTPE